jgi:hypothetical protein
MKKIRFKLVALLIMMIAFSCDEPVTVVTNIVHADGSVTRKIEMRNTKNNFEKSGLQVPFDRTWVIRDTVEVGVKGDTTWIKRAEKVFRNVDEINATYRNDASTNGMFPRHVSFSRKFRWFNTSYRYSEIIKGRMSGGYPLKDFLNDSELYYFYAPEDLKYSKLQGPDSLKYKMLADTIDKKTSDWNLKNLAAVWVKEFSELTAGKAEPELSSELPGVMEARFIKVIIENQVKFDSIWTTGILQKKILGEENGVKFKREADSALSVAFNRIAIDYKNYSVRIVMPGKLIRTNGYIDSTRNLMWPVNADLFFSEDYEMWAESKTPNIWDWVVSGLFLLFVITGIVLKQKK